MQLGSGNNYDFGEIEAIAMERLRAPPEVQIVVAEWLIADSVPELAEGVSRLSHFPNARYLNAFDFAISAAGYNSFHELIAAGVPTVFVPNENPMMDQQVIRAQHAERHGLGCCVRLSEIYRLPTALDRMQDAEFRAAVRGRCLALPSANGAVEAARVVEELVHTLRADRNPREFWTAN